MKKIPFACVALAVLVALSACHSSGDRAQSRADKQAQQEAEMKAAIPADSPLARLTLGMDEGQVVSILGEPTSRDMHTTGKQFIPFNFAGKDTMRTVYYYKGLGRVEFSSGTWGQRNGVVTMYSDTAEPGFRKKK